MIIRSILLWASFLPLAFVNGGFREMILFQYVSEPIGQLISSILLCLLVFVVCYLFIHKIGIKNKTKCFQIGVLWILLTIIFETCLILVMGNPIEDVINAYNITTGNFWLLNVIFIGVVPYFSAKFKKIIN